MAAELSPVGAPIDFARDGKQTAYLRFPHSRDSSAWGAVLIPITVVKNGSGPTLMFIGGSHGGEYEGPVSLMKLSRRLKAEEIQGRVIIIPALNLPAVMAGKRLSPIDGKDMNRVFPGAQRGTMTEVVAHYVHEILLPLCDAIIDLHAGGYSLNLLPYMSMHDLEDDIQNDRTLAAMKAFNAPFSLVINEISGEGLLDYAVERMGKIFLCAELGGVGTLSPRTLKIAETGVENLLKHFQVIAGDVAPNQPQTRLLEVPDPENYHTALANGVYESFFELGETVKTGQPLGQIHFMENPWWAPQVVTAQRSGILLCTRGPGLVEVGDCVAVAARERSSVAGSQ